MIAVMGGGGGERVFFNKIQEKPEAERPAYVQKLRDEYRADVTLQAGSELVVDEIVPGDSLRDQLQKRFEAYARRFERRIAQEALRVPV